MFEKVKKFIPLLLVLLLSYWTVKPLFIAGYFPMHDDTQPARVFALAQELEKGIFPVRLVDYLGYGYGYPLFNFYAPLPYYLGALFYLGGFDLIFATKLMFVTGSLLSGVFMFLLGNYLAGPEAGLLSALFYLYAPYHAVNIYVRGAVGEYYAYAFLPLIGLGLYRLYTSPKKLPDFKTVIPGILGLTGVLLSHNILGLITVYLLAVFIVITLTLYIFKKISSDKLLNLTVMILFAVSLSLFFTLPAFAEKKYTNVNSLTSGGSYYLDHFVSLSQLWDSPWGFAGSTKGLADGFSFKIGKLHLISALLSLIGLIYLYRINKLNRSKLYAFSTVILLGLFSIYMMLPSSAPIYQYLPYLTFIQYPWRFLNLTVFSLSLSPVTFIFIKNNSLKIAITVFLASLVMLVNSKYFNPQTIKPLTGKEYLNPINLRFTISKISDEYLPPDLKLPEELSAVPREVFEDAQNQQIEVLRNETTEKLFRLILVEKSAIRTNIAYFPGWQADLNGKKINLSLKNGRIILNLPSGIHILKLTFKDTPVRTVSNGISFFSFILLVYLTLNYAISIWLKNFRSK